MKPKILIARTVVILVLGIAACTKKDNIIPGTNLSATAVNSDALVLSTCDQFTYGDSVIYPIETSHGIHQVAHLLNPLSGTFGCYPSGLVINATNGDIDVYRSETGLRYMVWFKATGSTDTCKKYITIAGINFMDSIYVLTNKTQGLAQPLYNATPGKSVGGSTLTNEFDDGNDDDDGDGFDDEPLPGQEVIPQGVALDKTTGNIDLKQSIANGALGINPTPGTFKDFILNYRVSDPSANALNKLSFRLYYFHKTSEIPASLKKQYKSKRSLILFNQQQGGGPSGTFTSYNNLLTPFQKGVEVKCRPAYIIVVQQ